MKALILSRPGDFGVLEDHWPAHPLLLPVLNLPVYLHLAAYLKALGVFEVRVLRGGNGLLEPRDLALEPQWVRQSGGLDWSLRGWALGAHPQGLTLPEVLAQQRLFQDGEDLLVLSAPLLPLEPLTGPKIPPLFPVSESRLLAPRLLSGGGLLAQAELGTFASLASLKDYYRTQMRLLATVSPAGASLKGVHPRAVLEAPLLLGAGVRVAAHAQVGPECILAAGTRVDKEGRLRRTLVLSRVRVGRGAAFDGKVIIGTTVLDPENGGGVSIREPEILRVP
ncbi:MAG: hypothetical protein WCG80_03580 [Spirochaetales bacterium]